jgi:hypothetical protein
MLGANLAQIPSWRKIMADENTPDLLELLKKPMSEFPDLPNLPPKKHFYGKLLGMTAGHSSQKQTPLYNFKIRITEPGKDVTASELATITDAGFSLSDYEVGANFYLTQNALKMLRAFLSSLGFPPNVSFYDNLKLDEVGNPTPDTQEAIRGLDVMFAVPQPGDNGRVFLGNVDNVVGVENK